MRRRRYMQRRGGGGSLILVGILILAVAAGYAGTKYFIAPYLLEGKLWSLQGVEPETPDGGQMQPQSTTGSGIVSGQQDIKDAKNTTTDAAIVPEAVSGSGIAADKKTPAQEVQAPALTGKFAVQFGSFSTKQSAETAVSELAGKNITAVILQKGDSFKVIGSSFATKEQAAVEANRLRELAGDVYVTAI